MYHRAIESPSALRVRAHIGVLLGTLAFLAAFFMPRQAQAIMSNCIRVIDRDRVEDGSHYTVVSFGEERGCDLYLAAKLFPQINPKTEQPYTVQQQLRSIYEANRLRRVNGRLIPSMVYRGCVPRSKPWSDQTIEEKERCSGKMNYFPIPRNKYYSEVRIPHSRIPSESEKLRELAEASCRTLSEKPNPTKADIEVLRDCQTRFADIDIRKPQITDEQTALRDAKRHISSLHTVIQNKNAELTVLKPYPDMTKTYRIIGFIAASLGLIAAGLAIYSGSRARKYKDLALLTSHEIDNRVKNRVDKDINTAVAKSDAIIIELAASKSDAQEQLASLQVEHAKLAQEKADLDERIDILTGALEHQKHVQSEKDNATALQNKFLSELYTALNELYNTSHIAVSSMQDGLTPVIAKLEILQSEIQNRSENASTQFRLKSLRHRNQTLAELLRRLKQQELPDIRSRYQRLEHLALPPLDDPHALADAARFIREQVADKRRSVDRFVHSLTMDTAVIQALATRNEDDWGPDLVEELCQIFDRDSNKVHGLNPAEKIQYMASIARLIREEATAATSQIRNLQTELEIALGAAEISRERADGLAEELKAYATCDRRNHDPVANGTRKQTMDYGNTHQHLASTDILRNMEFMARAIYGKCQGGEIPEIQITNREDIHAWHNLFELPVLLPEYVSLPELKAAAIDEGQLRLRHLLHPACAGEDQRLSSTPAPTPHKNTVRPPDISTFFAPIPSPSGTPNGT